MENNTPSNAGTKHLAATLTHKSATSGVCALFITCSFSLAEETDDKTRRNILAVPEVRATVSACAADVSKLCAEVKPGEGRIVRCLITNAAAVDPACLASMASAKTALEKWAGSR